jgi:hypothetical protein
VDLGTLAALAELPTAPHAFPGHAGREGRLPPLALRSPTSVDLGTLAALAELRTRLIAFPGHAGRRAGFLSGRFIGD